ncbi:MAG TPA: MgtC/SapB family protein [Bosea sp. (in: a-proteobacteria)]|jgi:uncharacterized membrane protein (DUF4010 family)|uniref:MgtC/SapB family protein n=1 Tax=Bosea sp. (in: a-proteobacteria) TaxID=1871050 RepID=UPI002DDD448A|nr:MgtC/SapB family protein [Bosea sp. (in: a-proteobacteria)]HEV2553563.1 MgtC/SapB family protein [Bosea sp. (in: a-proteobacteria)]
MVVDENALLSRLAVSLAIGLLIGLERGWRSRDEDDHLRTAGLRTFALSGLLGGVTGLIGQQQGTTLIGLVFLGYSAAFAAFHWLEARAERNFSVTSVVAGMSTFMLGVLAVVGDLSAAIAGAVAMAVLLAMREQLHRWVASLSWAEIRSGLTLLAMTFLLLPILPNRTIDPWDAINPYIIWLLTILIAAVSFSGYVAIRIFGDRLGVMMAAVCGGLASSTATTMTLAELVRQHPESRNLLAAGILTAGLVMVARVAIVASALNPMLLQSLLLPLLSGGFVLAVGAGLMLVFSRGTSQQPVLKIANPLEMASALKMAALLTSVMLAAHLLQRYFGDAGVLATAGLSGMADVDAIVISMARMAMGAVDPALAAQAILLATAVNTLVKSVLAAAAGDGKLGLLVALVSVVAVAAGAVTALG